MKVNHSIQAKVSLEKKTVNSMSEEKNTKAKVPIMQIVGLKSYLPKSPTTKPIAMSTPPQTY
jgi:hypothetical protein